MKRGGKMSAYKKIFHTYTPEEKQLYWNLGNGLQAVDGLKPSDYLIEQQNKEIAGEIALSDVKANIHKYYELRKEDMLLSQKEADIASVRINEYLREMTFRLHPLALKQIHKYIFEDLDGFDAGEYRTYNVSKKEPVLFGKSVRYEDWQNIEDYLEYDIEKELRAMNKRTAFSLEEFTDFITGIWQIHPFKEGNTRTVAVFTIQYLNYLGFQINNEPFEKNASYFRDALVRASYNNMEYKLSPDFTYINNFFENVIYGKNHELNSENLIAVELSESDE